MPSIPDSCPSGHPAALPSPGPTRSTSAGLFWPDLQDQQICARFVSDYGDAGLGLCYVYGGLRGAGWPRHEAIHETLAAMVPLSPVTP